MAPNVPTATSRAAGGLKNDGRIQRPATIARGQSHERIENSLEVLHHVLNVELSQRSVRHGWG